MCALKLSVTETSLGSARPAKRTLRALFVKNASRRGTTRVTGSGSRGTCRGAATAGTPQHGMRPGSAPNIKVTQVRHY